MLDNVTNIISAWLLPWIIRIIYHGCSLCHSFLTKVNVCLCVTNTRLHDHYHRHHIAIITILIINIIIKIISGIIIMINVKFPPQCLLRQLPQSPTQILWFESECLELIHFISLDVLVSPQVLLEALEPK